MWKLPLPAECGQWSDWQILECMSLEISGIKFSSDKVTSYHMTTRGAHILVMGSCHQSQKRKLTASFKASVVLIALVPFCNTQYKTQILWGSRIYTTQRMCDYCHKGCKVFVHRQYGSLRSQNKSYTITFCEMTWYTTHLHTCKLLIPALWILLNVPIKPS